MSVILTSFRESDNILKVFPNAEPYSVSRWQPKGYFYDELKFLGAYDVDGKRLRLRGHSLDDYKERWKEYLRKNIRELSIWINSLDNDTDIVLCCWCPHSQATRNQMRIYGTFVCHTLLIGRLINLRRSDIELWLDHDHGINGVREWLPDDFKVLDI